MTAWSCRGKSTEGEPRGVRSSEDRSIAIDNARARGGRARGGGGRAPREGGSWARDAGARGEGDAGLGCAAREPVRAPDTPRFAPCTSRARPRSSRRRARDRGGRPRRALTRRGPSSSDRPPGRRGTNPRARPACAWSRRASWRAAPREGSRRDAGASASARLAVASVSRGDLSSVTENRRRPTTGSVEEIAGEATAGGATETSARAGDATRRERGGRAAPWNPGGGGVRAFDTRAGRRTLTDPRVSDVYRSRWRFGREPNDE